MPLLVHRASSIERLYTLAMDVADDAFDPETWKGATAEPMWKAGVGEVIEAAVPGSGRRLKEILELATAGAHDKAASPKISE